jgi:hypothetical protein
LGQNYPEGRVYQQYFLGKHYLTFSLSRCKPSWGLDKDTIFQEKKNKTKTFCTTHSLTFQADVAVLGPSGV